MKSRFVALFLLALASSIFAQSPPPSCTDCTCINPAVDCAYVCDVCICAEDVIDCRSKRLKATFSTNLSHWPKLTQPTKLYLDDNLLTRITPFPALNLTSISARGNIISVIDNNAFTKLELLEELDLSHNSLNYNDLNPEAFEGDYQPTFFEPLAVKALNLSFNELTDIHQDLFEHFPYLERLMLNGNPLADKNGALKRNAVVAIASVPKLLVLDLSETGLRSLPRTLLKNLPDLRELVLFKNEFTDVPADPLSFSTSLQILNLNYNPIQVISTERAFPSLPSLLQLHISYMPSLKRIEDKALQGLNGLTYLSCSNNPALEFISSKAMSSKNMTILKLQDNSLRYLSDKLIDRWERLKQIDVQGNKWACDCDNQWIVSSLVPMLGSAADSLFCASPEPMAGMSMKKLSDRNYQMRCLDFYGNHPEKDGAFLIATFVIVLLCLIVIGGVLIYKRGLFRRRRPVDYTAIYQQQVQEDTDIRF